jgi:transcriptional regulator with XRE-family HTH domain
MGPYSEFGDFIKDLRDRAGKGVRAAAKDIGISPSYLTRLEAGDYDPPKGHVIHRIAQVYGVPITALMDKAKSRQHDVIASDEATAPVVQAFYRAAHDQTPEVQELMLQGAINALRLSPEDRERLMNQLRAILAQGKELHRLARGDHGLFGFDIPPRILSRLQIKALAIAVLTKVFGVEIPIPVPLDTIVSTYDKSIKLTGRDDIEGGRLNDGSPAVLGLSRWSRDGLTRELVVHSELLDAEDKPGRRRANFTIAHEFFHCIEHLLLVRLRCPEAVMARRGAFVSLSPRASSLPWFERRRSARRLSTAEDWQEWQANQFAAELIMPEEALRAAIQELFAADVLVAPDDDVHQYADVIARSLQLDDLGCITSLVDRFDVNPQAMAIRLLSLGLVTRS